MGFRPDTHDSGWEKTPTRLKTSAGVSLLRLQDQKGRLHDFYGPNRVLPQWTLWSSEQVYHLLDNGLVELTDEAGEPQDPGRVKECASTIIALGLAGAGRPRAGDALRGNGFRYSNETISAALRLLKEPKGEAQ
jgi:hypothetical protein